MGNQGGRKTKPSWDIHAHAVPVEIYQLAESQRLSMRAEGETLWVNQQRLRITRMLDGEGLRKNRGEMADNVVLSVPPALLRYDLDEPEVWAQQVNDGMERLCTQVENTWALAYLPLNRPDLAVQEVQRRRNGCWLGYVIGTTVANRLLDDEALRPVFEALQREKSFVFIHPLQAPDARLAPYYLDNLLGNPVETGLAAAALIFSGRLLEYPDIRFCLAHGGGITAHLIGRWQHGYETSRPGIRRLAMPPMEQVRRLYVDQIVHHPGALDLCLQVFGPEHVLPGTDYPFPMGEPLAESLLHSLSNEVKEQIFYHNVPKLLANCGRTQEVQENP